MTKLLIKLAEKNNKRETYGILSGLVCIICNIFLCIFKFIVGSLSNSVSITADAINNLSDTASNIVTIIGSKLSAKPMDEDHPFGHGRIEYISSLAVSGLILLMGFELGKGSIEKIIHPNTIKFNAIYLVVLVGSILVKLWMAYFNNKLYKITENINLKAVMQDSLNDCISTFATIVVLIVSHFFNLPWLDGVVGLCVAIFILYSGIEIIKDIIGPLLGQPPSKELVKSIEELVVQPELVIGIHDLIVHDYGPGRKIASAHAEVPADVDILEIHDVIDNIEVEIFKKLGVVISIHMDPILVGDEKVEKYKEITTNILKEYNPEYTFHDFRVVEGNTHTNLIFDVVIPFTHKPSNEIKKEIKQIFSERCENINLVITIEHSYI